MRKQTEEAINKMVAELGDEHKALCIICEKGGADERTSASIATCGDDASDIGLHIAATILTGLKCDDPQMRDKSAEALDILDNAITALAGYDQAIFNRIIDHVTGMGMVAHKEKMTMPVIGEA